MDGLTPTIEIHKTEPVLGADYALSLASILAKLEQGNPLALGDAQRALEIILASPLSDQRQEVLVKFGRIISSRHPNSAAFLDQAIRALEVATEYTLATRFQAPPFFLCGLLFRRCTFPDRASFVDKAFKFLQRHPDSAIVKDAAGDMLLLILDVAQSQSRSDYLEFALRAVSEPLQLLANKPSLDLQAKVTLMAWTLLAALRAPDVPHTLTLLDAAHPHLTGFMIPTQRVSYLVQRAKVYALQCHRAEGPSFISAIGAIEDARGCIPINDISSVEKLCHIFNTLMVTTLEPSPEVHLLFQFVRWASPLLRVDSPERKWFLINRESVALSHFWRLPPSSECGENLPEHWTDLMSYCSTCMSSPVDLNAQDFRFVYEQTLQIRPTIVRAECVQSKDYPIGAVNFMVQAVVDSVRQIEPWTNPFRLFLSSFFAAFIARAMDVPTAMHAYRYIMTNLEAATEPMIPISMRFQLNRFVLMIIPDAISYAAELDQIDLALEWADQGRAVFWGQQLHLRFPYPAELHDADASLAKRWVDAKSQMKASQIIDAPQEPVSIHSEHMPMRIQSMNALRATIADIMKLGIPKFNRFFGTKTAEDIRTCALALGGPIVFLNPNRYSSSALAVGPAVDHVIHIPFPSIDYKILSAIQVLFGQYIKSGGRGEEVTLERIGKIVKPSGTPVTLPPHMRLSFLEVLRYLWIHVVKPVLDALKIKPSSPDLSEQLPRIWWCPSGPLSSLPIHAAGEYDKDEFGNKTFDYVVSSYIPSTSTILYATRPEEKSQPFHLLAVANPEGCRLPGTEGDLEAINTYVPDSQAHVTTLSKAEANVDAVKREMERATWIHFACHATQNPDLPLESALILAKHARLTLTEMTQLSLPHAEFAFLSACQTAQGTDRNPSEYAHLAAGLLVAGYRGVVGTMWNVRDDCAPKIARQVYKRLFEDGKPDYRRAAYVLHDAVQALRKEPDISFGLWVPFIHVGI